MECEICFNSYDAIKIKPYSLYPCGHTFCKTCLDQIQKQECPKCKREIIGEQINYALLDALDLNKTKVIQTKSTQLNEFESK